MKRLFAIGLTIVVSLALATPALAADPVRPFGGTTTGVDSIGAPTCESADVQYTSSGSGVMLHLGQVRMEVSHCTWGDSPTTGHFGPGTITFTAANGDMLVLSDWGTYQFVATPEGIFSYGDLHWQVMSGTGRFAGATGSGDAAPVSDVTAGTTTATFWGTLAY